MVKNDSHQYGIVAMSLHWLSAIAVLALFGLGFWMVDLSYYSEWYRLGPHYHKSVGLILAALTFFRIGWKFINVSPSHLGKNKVENALASIAHLTLYMLLIIIFISGYLISTADGRGIDIFDWLTIPSLGELIENQEDIAGDVHKYGAYILMGIVALHVIAALKHHFISKDNTLKRMLTIK